jgi:hypothetical protein
MAEAKEMLKDHKENKINFNSGSTLFSNFNDSQITDGSYVETPTKSKLLNDSTMVEKTMENGNMSFTNVDYGGISTDVTKMNESRMSLTQNDFGKIQSKLDDSRMSFTKNDFGVINETLNESRMSVTNSDYGKIQSKLNESKAEETRMSLTKNDFGKIYENLSKLNVPSSRKSLPQNNFQKFKKNISRLSLINPKVDSESKFDSNTPQEEELDKTQLNESRMSLTQNDFGKIQSKLDLSKFNQTINESRMSVTNSDYGNIQSKLDESRMSLTKNDFGNILESSSDQSIDLEKSKLNESRMSLTKNDFGNILEQKEDQDDSLMFVDSEQNSEESIDMGHKMSLTKSDYGMINEPQNSDESMDMGRMSITQSDYGKIQENKTRKSISLNDQTGLDESRMSLTKNDFGNILESSSDEDLEKSRMSLTISDFGMIQSKLNESRNSISKGEGSRLSIGKGDSRMSLSKNDKSRMSLTIEDFGKIHLVGDQSDESIDLDRMSMTKNDFGAITQVEDDSDDSIDTIEDSIDFDRMSLTKNDYGKLGENNETWDANLFAESDDEKETNQEKEEIDGMDDILSEMTRDHSMTLDFSKDLKGSTIFDEPTASELLDVNDFEEKKVPESVDLNNKTHGSPKTVTLQNVNRSKFQSLKSPNESIDFSQRSLNRSVFQNESIDFSQRSMTITTPSQKLIQSVKKLSTTKKSAKRNLSANIESVANNSNKRETTFELLSSSLKMTPQKRINEIRKNYINEKTETTQELLKFNPITVNDFFVRSSIRFLDDLTNQRRPKSPLDLKTMDASNNAEKLQIVSFVGEEIPILETACSKMLSTCEIFRKEVTNLEESYNLKNPYVFQHIQRIQGDELSDFCVRFKLN